jgi:hypothetical protein
MSFFSTPGISMTTVKPQPDQITEVRKLVLQLGGRLIEEVEARRRQTQEITQLRAEVSQLRAKVRTLDRR